MGMDKKKYQNHLESIDIRYLIFCIIFYYRKYQTVFEMAGTFNSVTCNQVHRLYFTRICIRACSRNYNDFIAIFKNYPNV